MNFERLVLIRLLRHKEIKLLLSLDQKVFHRGSHKVIFKALKSYFHKFGKIPEVSVLAEAMKIQLPADKSEMYVGMLEGFELYDKEIPSAEELKKNLADAHVITSVEQNLEKLVEASKERNIADVRLLLNTLQTATTSSNKTPASILDITYEPSKIKTIDPWDSAMRSNGLEFGGLSLISAGSGQGKSIFALQQALYSFKVDNIPTCILNLELGETEYISRMYSHATGQNFSDIYGNTDPVVVAGVNSWKQKYFSGDVAFNIKSIRYSADEIETTIREQASIGIQLFVLDYIQLVEMTGVGEDWKQLSHLVKLLHQLTMELSIVILTPIQVNMTDVKLEGDEITVSPRGSKELEFSSTLFLHLYASKEEYAEKVLRVFTIKSRNSAKATYILGTDFSHMRFNSTDIIM